MINSHIKEDPFLHANNQGQDQPVQPGSLISKFVVHSLESIIAEFASSKIPIFGHFSVILCISLSPYKSV